MQKTHVIKIGFLGTLCICLILLTSQAVVATQKASNWLDEPISISFQNEQLSKVLKQISEQTGVSIAYDQELANERVTGNYQLVKTSDAISRLFRKKNKSIQVNKTKKIIIVKTFGTKSFVWARMKSQNYSPTISLTDLEDLEDLNVLHEKQNQEYQKSIHDPNFIIPGMNITRAELDRMHEKQNREYQKSLNDPNFIIPGMNITRAELDQMHEKQNREYQKSLNDPNFIIPGMNMTRAELDQLNTEVN